MGLCPKPHILFCLDTKKDAKKVKAQAVFPKNYGSPGMRNTTDSMLGGFQQPDAYGHLCLAMYSDCIAYIRVFEWITGYDPPFSTKKSFPYVPGCAWFLKGKLLRPCLVAEHLLLI